MPYDHGVHMRHVLKYLSVFVIALPLLVGTGAYAMSLELDLFVAPDRSAGQHALRAAGAALVAALLVASVIGGMAWYFGPRIRTTLTAEKGWLTVRKAHRNEPIYQGPLLQFAWHLGKAHEPPGFAQAWLPVEQSVIVLDTPGSLGWWPRAACVWTDETLGLWKAFLKIAGVVEHTPEE